MVMVYHFAFKAVAESNGLLGKMTPIEPFLPSTWMFSWWGWVGVQLFFTISGVVIAFSASSPKATPGRFMRSRFLRLWPVVIVSSCFAAIVEYAVFEQSLINVLILWLKTVFFHPLPPWLMGQFWTLGIEVMFYALLLVLIVIGRVRWLPQLGGVLIAISAAYWCVRILNGGTDPIGRITQLLLFQHGAYFGVGIILAARMSLRPARWHFPALLVALVTAAVQIKAAAGWEAGHAGLAVYWPIPLAIYVIGVALVWVSMAHNESVVDRIGLSGAHFVRRLGIMTYPLYLIHNHVGKPVILAALDMGVSLELAIALAMLSALAVAWCIAALLEPPLYSWISRRYDRAWAMVARSG